MIKIKWSEIEDRIRKCNCPCHKINNSLTMHCWIQCECGCSDLVYRNDDGSINEELLHKEKILMQTWFSLNHDIKEPYQIDFES